MKNYATKRSLLVLVLTGIFVLLPFGSSTLFAAPTKVAGEAVAEGYPAWTGITPKNYIAGRMLMSNAELRQRVTVVVEFDAEKAKEQLTKTGSLTGLNGFTSILGHGSVAWETIRVPRDVMVIYVAHNLKSRDKFLEVLREKEPNSVMLEITKGYAPIYEGVTFDGAPDSTGKLPFVYVMGVEGKEPLVKETFGAKTRDAVKKAISGEKKKLQTAGLEWRNFYGYVAEPKHFPDVGRTLAKGKPSFEVVEAKIRKSVTSKDAEVAKEAQMLCDALAQTKSDFVFIAQRAYRTSPHVAGYNASLVLKYWPKTKKTLKELEDQIKANAEAQPLIKVYTKIAEWSDPNFTCKDERAAKAIVAEINKLKKQIAPAKDSKNINIQGAAQMIDSSLDDLITAIPLKVQSK